MTITPCEIGRAITQTLEGDLSGFGLLVEEFQGMVHGTLAAWGIRREQIFDLAQETFIAAFRALPRYKIEMPFSSWLKGIARNVARRYWEAERTREAGQRDFALFFSRKIQELEEVPVLQDFRRDALLGCLQKLPERSREIVRRRYGEKQASPEIAGTLGLNPDAVRTALVRIRLKLKECLEKELALGNRS